jgi:glyoxylase-like metal-dependent hydrolase (beta-lactamase superfamily II)
VSGSASSAADPVAEQPAVAEFTPDLGAIRRLAQVVPGPLPVAVNGIRVAASIRPRKFVIQGGDETPVTMPRTAFQLVYPDCTVMIDSGMDQATHDSFSPDKPEPYYPEAYAQLERALAAARLIILTHYHADHVAGVVTAKNFATLAQKTIASTLTLDLMVTNPHRPHLAITPEQAALFIALDYKQLYPVAPGVVLIKAPGHSPDQQMVYARLKSGREILHSVDSAWIFDNILQIRPKAAPWVKEDVPAIMAQLRWLNYVHGTEPNLTILVTHDDARFDALARHGIIGELA